ncbi:MAG: hypothetical protein KAJ40_07480 [Alphaproteobacteria bacterium]|nr:hypothetical protein [Alphaproteobacteria bacterium]
MAKSGKKQKTFFWAGLALCLFLAAIGNVLHKDRTKHEAAIATHETTLLTKQKERKEHKSEIQALFDAYLNNFTSELVHKANLYKKSRLLLKKITIPIHYKTVAFSKQNYTLFKEDLAPTLRAQGEDIVNLFGHYSDKIRNDLKDNDSELQQIFLKQWNDMTIKQLDHYITFFMREEKLIQAYDDLITFYYTHARRYYIDIEKNKFVFSDSKDTNEALMLLKRIQNIQNEPTNL